MKRMHVHVSVENVDRSIAFYSILFGAAPAVVKSDYAKWMLDDPRVNFAISAQGLNAGIDHLGIQVEERAELDDLSSRLNAAGQSTFDQEATTCCYAQSDKSWVNDPSSIRWETFYTFGEATTYGEDASLKPEAKAQAACCAPSVEQTRAKACC